MCHCRTKPEKMMTTVLIWTNYDKCKCTIFLIALIIARGVHPSEAMMHFLPCFRFPPYFRDIFWTSCKIFPNWPFSKTFSISSAKISDDFFVIHHKFLVFPLFRKIFNFPLLLQNFPPDFIKFTCFYILYVYFVSPLLLPWCIYASPNALLTLVKRVLSNYSCIGSRLR